MKSILPTEHQIQSAFIKRVRMHENRFPALRTLLAIPNGSWRHPATAARLKAEGVRPGAPDILLPVPSGKYAGLALEFKRQRNGHLSPAQRAYQSYLIMFGWRCETVWDAEQAWKILMGYLEIK